jgi:SAM-dependent methyltransferase
LVLFRLHRERLRAQLRSASDLRAHYEIERELAARLRAASRAERRTLYRDSYNELFQRVGSHPQRHEHAGGVAGQLRVLERYLRSESVFLEIGAGDCALALAVAERVRYVYAIEVSTEITEEAPRRDNCEIILTDGLSLPVPSGAATLAYSNQVFEHLHPDDGLDHLRLVYRALEADGRYICITPNRLTGPHDISMYFDDVASGFHLREYTATELATLMRTAGFDRVEAWTTRKGMSLHLPWLIVRATETLLGMVPRKLRRKIGEMLPARIVLSCYVVGVKSRHA